jgi:hypothetical protein
MNKYYIKMTVSFCGEIEAESEAEANDIAYSGWGENSDAIIQYDGVEKIDVDDLGEICADCDDVDCTCEEEEEGAE